MNENIELKDIQFKPDDFELAQAGVVIHDEEFKGEAIGFFKDAWIRLCRNKGSVVAAWIIVFLSVMAIMGPSFNEFGFNDQDVTRTNGPPRGPFLENFGILDGTRQLYARRYDRLDDPSKYPEGSVIEVTNMYEINGVQMCDVLVDYYAFCGIPEEHNFWFGTDYLGRDLWTRTWRGARVSLLIAVVSVAANIAVGIVYGAVAGYYGGSVDMVMMRITEIIQAFPNTIVATMLILVLGTGIEAIILAMVIRGWVGTAKMIRAQFLRFKGREYVLAARTLGISDRALIFRHILPNAIGPTITSAMVSIPSHIFSESFLAFIGLGVQAPEPSMGVLLSDAQKVLTSYPYQTFFPAIIISILMISFNLFGNGLRDAFNPTQRGV